MELPYLPFVGSSIADQGPSLRPTTGPAGCFTGGHLGVVKILCELRADTDKGATRYSASPLFTAAEYGHAEADKRGWDGGWGLAWHHNMVKWLGLTLAF